MSKSRFLSLLVLAFIVFGCGLARAQAAKPNSVDPSRYWPTKDEIDGQFGIRQPTAAQRHANAAVEAAKAQNFEGAIREWTKVIRLMPRFSSAYYYRAAAYEQVSDKAGAIADLTKFLELSPRSAAGWAARGINRAEMGHIEQALRDCDQALRLEPRNALALALRADVYRLGDRFSEALRDADRAIALQPRLPRAYQVKGRVYEETKNYRSAVSQFNKVIKLAPTWQNGYTARGYSYAAMGDYRAALQDFRRAQRLAPKSPVVLNDLAWFYATCPDARWRDGKLAIKEATNACTITGWRDPDCLDTLAAALAETGQFDQAIRREQEAIKLSAKQSRASYEHHLLSYQRREPFREKLAQSEAAR